MAFLPGTDKKPSFIESVFLAVLGIFLLRVFLPVLASWALDIVNEITSTAERLAMPCAIAAGLLGALVMLSPLHRTHAGKLVGGAFGCAALAGLIIPALTWMNGNIPGLGTGALNALASLAHAFGI
jgi:hypothetical protein